MTLGFGRGVVSGSVVLIFMVLGTTAQAALNISTDPTQNVSCAGGICTATAKKAVLNVSDLTAMLAAGDATVKSGSIAQDIDVNAAISWTSTGRLTLDSQRNIAFKHPVSVAGTGALTLVTNDGGSGGDLQFVPRRGRIEFWNLSSNLVINGHSYTLFGDIQTLANIIYSGGSGYYALARSYDASADGGFSGPISDLSFDGTLEGLGNVFSHITMYFDQDEPYDGLLSVIGGTVRDLGLSHADVEGYEYIIAGMLAGANSGTVQNCWTSGVFNSGTATEGALVGENDGQILNSHTDVKASGYSDNGLNFGGIAGENDGLISGSYTLGLMTFGGNVTSDAGGLVGLNKGAIVNSYARNRMDGTGQLGGSTLGGLVGTNGGTISNSYAAGKIVPGAQADLGGLIGVDSANPGEVTAAYWDLDKGVGNPAQGAGNIANDPGITGLTDAQLKSALPDGFDPRVWGQNPNINNGYPYLLANPPPSNAPAKRRPTSRRRG